MYKNGFYCLISTLIENSHFSSKLSQQIGKIEKSSRDDQQKYMLQCSTISSSYDSLKQQHDKTCDKIKQIEESMSELSKDHGELRIFKADAEHQSMASICIFHYVEI